VVVVIATDRLVDVFVEVADTLVADFDLMDFLHNVADHTAAISGASAVGLVLADENDRLQFMAASSEGARHMELFQLQMEQGPCLDCFRTGRPVIVTDLDTAAGRWPAFVPVATAGGIHSVHAFPMRLRDRVIGALNVFGEAKLPLEEGDIPVIQALADVATISVIQEQATAAAETLTQQLQGALNSRIVIEQTKGAVAQTHNIGVDEAFTLLRTHARHNGLRLTALCHDILAGAVDPAVL
jgi:GAF domain-containing protein